VTAWGLEPLAAAELTSLGAADVEAITGGVRFRGDLELLYRANLWLRTATRIVRPLREFAAGTPEMLYSQVRRVRWEEYLNPQRTLAVYATIQGSGVRSRGEPAEEIPATAPSGRRGKGPPTREPAGRATPRKGITHSQYAALKIKDAICDRLRREQGARPNIDTEQPDIRVQAHFAGGRCILSLDSSGASLHERGYRLQTTGAPLKETLAAAIIQLTGWDGRCPLIDPMCGSGTLLIEAALQARRIAPGLLREHFGFERWPDFDRRIWDRVRSEARREALPECPCTILGFDADRRAIQAAIANARRAGVENSIRFAVQDLEGLTPPTASPPGVLVVNPPYGERLGKNDDLATLYRRLGEIWKERFPGWTGHVLAGNLQLSRSIPLRATDKPKLYNSALECRLLKFPISLPTPDEQENA